MYLAGIPARVVGKSWVSCNCDTILRICLRPLHRLLVDRSMGPHVMQKKQDSNRRELTSYGRRASDRRGTLERHAQTVLVSLVILLIGWVGLSITELRDTALGIRGELALVAERVNLLQKQVDLSSSVQYSAAQAVSDFRLRDQRIEENSRRLVELEKRVGEQHLKRH